MDGSEYPVVEPGFGGRRAPARGPGGGQGGNGPRTVGPGPHLKYDEQGKGMLSRDKLIDLYRELREEYVLSVYIDGRVSEFSDRNLWKKRLERGVTQARERAQGQENGKLEGFDDALSQIQEELGKHDGYLPNRGWVGFATPERVWYAEAVRVPMPDLVCWEPGIRVAPYVRALKQARPVITVLVDQRRGRIFEYLHGEIEEPTNVIAEEISGDLSDVSSSKRATSHSGVRGKTATDAAQKVLDVESDRLRKRLADKIAKMAGDHGYVVLGGTPEATAQLKEYFSPALQKRSLYASSLHLEMTPAQVRTASEDAASLLTQSRQEELLEEVVNQAHSGGKGALGPAAVQRALRESRVETLLLSRSFLRANPDFADHLVGHAFQQHADVEELSFDGAERLDREGEGLAARLRFRLPEEE